MAISEQEAKEQWQAAWRRMPAAERGNSQRVFAFIREYGQDLPAEWDGLGGEPWTTIHGWLEEADQADGIEWH